MHEREESESKLQRGRGCYAVFGYKTQLFIAGAVFTNCTLIGLKLKEELLKYWRLLGCNGFRTWDGWMDGGKVEEALEGS